jgi:hypothetical protein
MYQIPRRVLICRSSSQMRLTRALLSGSLLCAISLAGCGSQGIVLPPPPPHGGTAFALPDGKGFVEALRKFDPDRPDQSQLVVYFLDAECKPLPTAPTAASFKPRGSKRAQVALKLTAEAELQKAGGLACPSFSDPGDIVGVLSATIDNKPVSIAISVR